VSHVADETELLLLLCELNARRPPDAPPLTFEELSALAAVEWDDEEAGPPSSEDPR
jgi:hypothetical protein